MKPSLLVAVLLACAPAFAGPRETSAPANIPGNGGAPQVVVSPVSLNPAGLNPGIVTGTNLPGSAAANAGIPGLPTAAAASSGGAAKGASAAGAEAAEKTQAAPQNPPKGPNGPNTEEAGGPPGGPPHNPNDDGPPPGQAGGGVQNRSALAQLRAELSALQRQLSDAKASVAAAGVMSKEYRGGAAEAVGRAHEKVSAIESQIVAKKAQIKDARAEEKAHYSALKQEISQLKKERDGYLAEAASVGSPQENEFKGKGGGDEARARALERAAALELDIEARREQVSFIERENPGFAGLRAPFVALKNALGFAPRSAEEKKLRAQISALEREREGLQSTSYRARNGVHDLSAKTVDEITEAVHKRLEAIDTELAAKRAELNSLPSPISASGEERRLASEIAALDKEQQKLEATALRILTGQKDAPSVAAVETAQAAQKRAAEIRGEIELKRAQLRSSRTISRR